MISQSTFQSHFTYSRSYSDGLQLSVVRPCLHGAVSLSNTKQLHAPTSYPGLSFNNTGAGENVLHFDWLIKQQYAKSKILESREIIIAKTNFEPSKWQKENQNQRNKLFNMSLKLCEPKNILEKKGVLMLRHICYDTNGSALKASGTLMIH